MRSSVPNSPATFLQGLGLNISYKGNVCQGRCGDLIVAPSTTADAWLISGSFPDALTFGAERAGLPLLHNGMTIEVSSAVLKKILQEIRRLAQQELAA